MNKATLILIAGLALPLTAQTQEFEDQSVSARMTFQAELAEAAPKIRMPAISEKDVRQISSDSSAPATDESCSAHSGWGQWWRPNWQKIRFIVTIHSRWPEVKTIREEFSYASDYSYSDTDYGFVPDSSGVIYKAGEKKLVLHDFIPGLGNAMKLSFYSHEDAIPVAWSARTTDLCTSKEIGIQIPLGETKFKAYRADTPWIEGDVSMVGDVSVEVK